jgi:hypothetical protein
MESLHTENARSRFVLDCTSLWKKWLEWDADRRQLAMKQAVQAITWGYMIAPALRFEKVAGGGAEFNPAGWVCKIDRAALRGDPTADEYTELCNSVYHENRHAEQYFRIAQGLASGDLTLHKKDIVNSKNRAATVAEILHMNAGIARAADIARAGFAEFAQMPVSTRHPHAADGWGDTAEEWMRCLCGTDLKLTMFAQEFAQKGHVGMRLYQKLPVEVDAYCIAEWAVGPIALEIDPNDLYRNTRRSKIKIPPPAPSKSYKN